VIAELLALMRALYMRKERVCYRENQAFSSEMRPTINKALLIYRSTSDPGNPEMPKEEHTCLCTRTSSSRGCGSKRGVHTANASDDRPSSAAIPCLHKSQWFSGNPHPQLIVLR
jgi:hypothetical protein